MLWSGWNSPPDRLVWGLFRAELALDGVYQQNNLGTFGGVMVSKLDLQTYMSEFESHLVPHSFCLVPHQSKELCKLLSTKQLKLFTLVSVLYFSSKQNKFYLVCVSTITYSWHNTNLRETLQLWRIKKCY